jgi:tetratricopeptide (TPR) repeat protein
VAAERIRQRPAAVREAIVAALDEWDLLAGNPKYKISEPHREWLRAVLEAAEPDDAWGRQVRAARRETDAGKRQEALEALAKSARITELPARALTQLAQQLRPPQAVELLRRAQRHYPADFWVNHNLGRVLLEEVKPPETEEAVRFLTAAVALRPESPGVHYNLGHALVGKGRWDEAISSYKKAIVLDPKDADAYFSLGRALKNKGELDDAIASYQKAINFDPENAAVHTNLGLALQGKDRWNDAMACHKKAVDLDPENAWAHNNLADILANAADPKLRDPKKAVAHANEAIKLKPDFGDAWNTLGEAYYRNDQWKEAITALLKGTELRHGGTSEDFFFLAMAYFRDDNKDQARIWYQKGIAWMDKHAPRDPTLLRYRGEAASVLGVK